MRTRTKTIYVIFMRRQHSVGLTGKQQVEMHGTHLLRAMMIPSTGGENNNQHWQIRQ